MSCVNIQALLLERITIPWREFGIFLAAGTMISHSSSFIAMFDTYAYA